MPDIVSSASPDTLPTIAEEAGAPQELTPEREAEIREWRDELGSGTSFLNVGPYCALHDALGEIDRLRAELSAVRKERDEAQERVRQLESDLADYTEPDMDGAGRTYQSYQPQAQAQPVDDLARCLKVHPFSPRDGWRMVCSNCDHGKNAECHRMGGAS